MIQITSSIFLDEREILFEFIRASGPGGQNVNKVASAVQLRFDVQGSPSLPDDVRQRLIHLAGRRITEEGILVLEASRYRTQEQNREEALQRLMNLVRAAAVKPRPRRQTRPTLASQQRRLATKKQRADVKRLRQRIVDD
ncbi:MAG: aminoacyl-tRNA hydrolase [Anaerolineales bacterium]|jgi:ribosome-associated protein|nr:aminoacyl-tRNA hydrolase [Anaerolineales bacterium]